MRFQSLLASLRWEVPFGLRVSSVGIGQVPREWQHQPRVELPWGDEAGVGTEPDRTGSSEEAHTPLPDSKDRPELLLVA